MKTKIPKAFEGMNLSWNLNIFSFPKFKVKCGECSSIFKGRINEQGLVKCPYCDTINKLPLKLEK